VARAAEAGAHLLARLRTLESLDGVGHVRGLGLMAAVEVVADAHTKQLHAPQLGVAQKLTDAMLARGLYTRVAMDCICLAPPLITDDADLDRIVDIVGESITEVLKAVPQAAVAP
jgi:4-aminobutyrate--pyruvate transaminase